MNIAHVHMQPIVSLILGCDYVIIIIRLHQIRHKCLVKILHLKPAKGLPYGVKILTRVIRFSINVGMCTARLFWSCMCTCYTPHVYTPYSGTGACCLY